MGEESRAIPTLEVGANRPNLAANFAADTNSYTLTRQSENIAGLEVEWRGFSGVRGGANRGVESGLQRLPTGEPCFDVVPPLDVVAFVGFPAQQDDSAFTHGRKIYQAVVVIFQLNSEGL